MKLIIDISDEDYRKVKDGKASVVSMRDAIRNGTPLPKPFDLDGFKEDMKALNCGYPYGLDYLLDCLDKRLGITINGK